MLNMINEPNVTGSKALIRFMLYTDVNRRRATKLGEDVEADLKTVLGGVYDYGTQHELQFDELDNKPGRYVVAMLPYIRQIPHPEKSESYIPVRLVYLTTVSLWPFFESIADETVNIAMLPE